MDVLAWLLDGDPAVRWQALRDLADAPAGVVAAERARVAHEGWGAALLDRQDADGQWAGGACFPAGFDGDFSAGQPWTSTLHALDLLRLLGPDPTSPRVREAVERAAAGCRWEYDGSPFFAGEVEACINGRTLAVAAAFGVTGGNVDGLVDRLLADQRPDGGWNCEPSPVSSFHSTTCVLEGLLGAERAGRPDVAAARARGEEYLLERRLLRRRSTGEVVDPVWLRPAFPPHWHHDVLRGLEHLRAADRRDPRADEALDVLRAARRPDGTWGLDHVHAGALPVVLEEPGAPSRWNTLRALRVLRWADGQP